MPYVWVDPEVFMEHNGVTVFHVYKNDFEEEGRRAYQSSTDPAGEDEGDFVFDVRALSTFGPSLTHKEIIAKAIDLGEVVAPE